MVTRETSYIGQLYFGLSTDDPTGIEWHNGDRILLMDQDQMLVYDEDAGDFKPISMGGGGGGGMPAAMPVLASGSYTQTSQSTATVHIPISATGDVWDFACAKDSLTGVTSKTVKWYRARTLIRPNMDDHVYTMICQTSTLNSSGTEQFYARTGSSGTPTWLNTYADPTEMMINPYSSSYPIPAGTYNWYLWGRSTT